MSLDSDPKTTLADEIRELLGEFRGTHSLKRLFWELLGYDRRDEAIVFSGSSTFRSSVIQARLLASHESFHVYYVTLIYDALTPPIIRQICRYFRTKHRYVAVLVSDVTQTRWHLAYLTDGPTVRHSHARLATMTLGDSEENLRRQAIHLTRLKTYDANDESVNQLELVAAYDEVFTALRSRTNHTKWALDDLAHLLETIGRYPLLSAQQERAILIELDQISDTLDVGDGDRPKIVRVPDPDFLDRYDELRGQLVLHNQRLCFHYAKRYSRSREDLLDLFQEAVIGLLRAIEKFDIRRNVRFATYAVFWIKQRFHGTYWTTARSFACPGTSGFCPKQERPEFSVVPLEGGDKGQPYDFEDDSSHAPSLAMERDDGDRLVNKVVETLPERDASIVTARFGLNGSRRKTLEEIGQELNLTKERVRQIESRAMGMLRDRLIILGQDEI
jgi:RNA polymerase primary sigma factor